MTEPRSWLEANAGKTATIPIAGLLIGALAGVVRVKMSAATDLDAILIVVKNALAGSFLGMGATLVVAGEFRKNVMTVGGLVWLTVATAVSLVFWLSFP